MRLPLPVSIADAIDAARRFASWHGIPEDQVRIHTEDGEVVFTATGAVRSWHCNACQVSWRGVAVECWRCGQGASFSTPADMDASRD